MTMRLLGMMTVDNDVYCNKYEQVTRSMFIHKQLVGAEDRRYTTVSTDRRTTTNSSSLLARSARRATLLQQAAAAAEFRSIHSTLQNIRSQTYQ